MGVWGAPKGGANRMLRCGVVEHGVSVGADERRCIAAEWEGGLPLERICRRHGMDARQVRRVLSRELGHDPAARARDMETLLGKADPDPLPEL